MIEKREWLSEVEKVAEKGVQRRSLANFKVPHENWLKFAQADLFENFQYLLKLRLKFSDEIESRESWWRLIFLERRLPMVDDGKQGHDKSYRPFSDK